MLFLYTSCLTILSNHLLHTHVVLLCAYHGLSPGGTQFCMHIGLDLVPVVSALGTVGVTIVRTTVVAY